MDTPQPRVSPLHSITSWCAQSALPVALPSGVCQSIIQPVTKEWLLEVIEKHRWKPPPSSSGVKRAHPGDSEQLMPPPKIIPRPQR